MQWSWYGGGGGYLGDYYSCVNFQVAGGVAVTAKQLPTFKGGDVSNPGRNDLCEYWTTNVLHYCYKEPCGETVCKDTTAPVGHCDWPSANGRPNIPELQTKIAAGTCHSYAANLGAGQTVPKQAQLTSTVNVPDTFNVASISVNNIKGNSDWQGALDFYLENPQGSRIMLLNRWGCNQGGNFYYNVKETASTSRYDCPPTSGGPWKPIDSFTWFNNVPANGNWKLVVDNRDGTRAVLTDWTLELCEVAGAAATSRAPPPPVPATSNTPTPPPPSAEVPEITVKVTVTLPMKPATLDVTTFIYDVMKVLGLPLGAIKSVQVDLDKSTDTLTYVQFLIVNALKKDGTRVDPVAASIQLRDKAAAKDSAIQNSLMLQGLEFVGSEEVVNSQKDDFTKTTGFIVLIAVLGGVVLFAIVGTVIGLVVYRKKKYGAWY
jgi:hypothetical protein